MGVRERANSRNVSSQLDLRIELQSNRQLLAAMAARLKPLLPEIVFVGGCTTGLRRYIGKEVGRLLDNPEFVNALPGYLAGDEISQARVPMVLRTLNSLRGLGSMRSAPRQKRTTGPKSLKNPPR